MIEYFPMPSWDSLLETEVEPIFFGEPVPERGKVTMGREPGLGVTVNDKIFS